jgi:DNA processing protein
MTDPGRSASHQACASCVRRSWLLANLSPVLDRYARDHDRLLELLALEDEQLILAAAGRRRDALRASYRQFDPGELAGHRGQETVCRHSELYPSGLRSSGAPHMLSVAGGASRLQELAAAPVVAILGSTRASDYGMEVAASLGRGLSAAGVTVTSGLVDGVSAAAHLGALEARGRSVAVIGGGLDAAPARHRSLYERVGRRGCVVSELPLGCSPRGWGAVSAARIVARLAGLSVVVEAEERSPALLTARIAGALGHGVAAVPGRVSSPLSHGSHALLLDGASLLRGAQDAIELLYALGTDSRDSAEVPQPPAHLERRLQRIFDLVAAGHDTPDKLAGAGLDADAVLLALTELELMGLLIRGDGARYVSRCC